MGVPGLWKILEPAKISRSLLGLTLSDNPKPFRKGRAGYRIGIDVSIWFFHATYGAQGENHELRLLFFRLARLLDMPSCLPLFVFDGPDRPRIKRGKVLTQKHHWMENGMKNLVAAFGFEWLQAPGEAEAELAYLNRIDLIDAVMTDDVDALLFGAPMIIRTLAGKGSKRTNDESHVALYRLDDIGATKAGGIALSQGGLILIAVLSGGDYDKGIGGCGVQISYALARCGFGEELLNIGTNIKNTAAVSKRLCAWRLSLCEELRTNSQGHLGRTYNSLANSIPDTFPSLVILRAYLSPLTSESSGKQPDDSSWWSGEPQLPDLGMRCELYFEWGFEDAILHRFRTLIWPAFCKRLIWWTQTRAPPSDRGSGFSAFNINNHQVLAGVPPPLVVRIHSSRRHHSTDGILEYRVEINPNQLATHSVSNLKGTRSPSSAKRTKAKPSLFPPFRLWLPAFVAATAIPQLVVDFQKRGNSKTRKAKRPSTSLRGERAVSETSQEDDSDRESLRPPRKVARKALKLPTTKPINISSSGDEAPIVQPGRPCEIIDLTGISDTE